MLVYITTTEKDARRVAACIHDGRRAFRIYTDAGRAFTTTAAGLEKTDAKNIPDAETERADAVRVNVSMTEKELINARRIAATREGLRSVEKTADDILKKRTENMTRADVETLLSIVRVAYHDSGKIEGCFSIDGCASCGFCQKMINAAACNPLMICGACYAARDRYKETSWRRHTLNARIMSTVLFTLEELATLPVNGRLCRFNEDGDTVNCIHARNLLRIAATHPETRFAYFYKNTAAVESGLNAEGYRTREQLPDNVIFTHSSVYIGIPARETWYDDNIFTVYPTPDTLRAALTSGAHECNGRRCRECGYNCFMMKRRPDAIHTAEILRGVKPAGLAVIMDALQQVTNK